MAWAIRSSPVLVLESSLVVDAGGNTGRVGIEKRKGRGKEKCSNNINNRNNNEYNND